MWNRDRVSHSVGWLALAGVVALLLSAGPTTWAVPKPENLPLEETLKKARADGKYEMLLAQIKVEKDLATHKEFDDYGFRNVREYAGYKNLPQGYWVYAYPYWYIWRDESAVPKNKRSWGPEQAAGEPNSMGESASSWCPQTADGQDEWLLLEYSEPVVPTAVLIHENYAPGAVNRVAVFKLDGSEVEAWKGKDPTSADEAMGVSLIPVKVDFKVNRVKIYINSKDVPNWNEIDAVGLRDADKNVQWANTVEASSTYASAPFVMPASAPDRMEQRITRLEKDIKELKAQNAEIKQTLQELKELLKK